MNRLVLADVVERNARLRGDAPAFLFEGRALSHREFAVRSFGLGNALLGLGLPRQARVAVLAQNRPEYFEAFAGIGAAGLITVNLNWRLSALELSRIVADAEPDVLLFDAASEPLANALRGAPSIKHCIAFAGESPGGVSPPGAPRTVLEPLGSHGSRCSAVVERLCLVYRAPPVTGWLWAAAEQRSPFGPVPLQNLHPYYELLRPCAPHRYSSPCGVRRLGVSLRIGATGSHVPYKSLVRLRAAYMPDAARAGFRTTPELIPEESRTPGFDIV